MENTLQKTFSIESLDVNSLPELQGLKEKQIHIRDSNPYVEIIDNKTYEDAKKARTTLVSARTDIEKQEKVISKKINDFKSAVKDVHIELINITKPSEDKQQDEVRRYEAVKEAEKAEKERLEQERINNIKIKIDTLISEAYDIIKILRFSDIDSLSSDFEENLYKTELAQFEEFELDFNEKLIHVKNSLSEKIQALTESENQRLEKLRLEEEAKRLAEERAEIERKRKEDEEKLAAERKAEEDRLAKIKADQEAKLQKERERIAAEKAKQDEELAAKRAEIEAENKKIQDEKNRLAQVEADRIAKEESERKAKEEEERKVKEAAEAEERAKAEAARLESLRPDKEKAISYLKSFKYSDEWPEFNDNEIEKEFESRIRMIDFHIEEAIKDIQKIK
ncbi:hypothetical protein [Elizabethkingia miricola]|uniref:hypothetical protein n=1 Tax=Elizabethkingia miricola TaxID=172045 RepID=UPI000B355DCC|nr:hypothetical protein [Elizabethkingia miricola]